MNRCAKFLPRSSHISIVVCCTHLLQGAGLDSFESSWSWLSVIFLLLCSLHKLFIHIKPHLFHFFVGICCSGRYFRALSHSLGGSCKQMHHSGSSPSVFDYFFNKGSASIVLDDAVIVVSFVVILDAILVLLHPPVAN